jgi:transposase
MARKRYPSDLSDAQWAILKAYIPEPLVGGRPADHDRREIVNAILYVLRTGCGWNYVPHDFPPAKTVYDYFRQWRESGVWEQANAALREAARQRAGRKATPSGAVIDSQSVKTTEKGG